jgi:uncharacterized protein YjbI with pentapeptide repeats
MKAMLQRADLFSASLNNAKANFANLEGANLTGANLYNAYFDCANLRGATLINANLCRAHLIEADLSGANLNGANFSGAVLHRATLAGADLRFANLEVTNFMGADLSAANLAEADLTGALLVEAHLEKANLTGCRVYGASVWNVRMSPETVQSDLIITRESEPTVRIDDIHVAQFTYLLLQHQHLRNVLNAVMKHGVLVLGRFGGGGLEVLRDLANALRTSGYLPMIFDFVRPDDRSFTETVQTLAGLARFVIVDLSGPSVPQELYATVPHLKIPFVPILEKGKHTYEMFADLLEYDWVMKPVVEFDSISDLTQKLHEEIISPAEKRIEARQVRLRKIFG